MTKRDEFKPGLFDFYLVQYPTDQGEVMLNVIANRGKKAHSCPPTFSFEKGVHYAGLAQWDCATRDEVFKWIRYYGKMWGVPLKLEPAVIEDIAKHPEEV